MEKFYLRNSTKILLPFIFLPVVIFASIQFSGVYQVYTVMSNSNAPTYETGDIVILNKKLSFDQYRVGDTVLYFSPLAKEIVIHRIYDIKMINGSYYFAFKGDSNPQPDSGPQIDHIKNAILINQSINWNSFYGNNSTNPTAKYIVVSYFPASEVIDGKVIYKIPLLGWIFTPFNSPITDPFNILPFSLFSFFSLYYAILVIVTIFILIHIANEELKILLKDLASVTTFVKKPGHIHVTGLYTFIFYPLIFFIVIFFSAIPTSTHIHQIQLESIEQKKSNNIDYTELIYHESKNISSVINQHNVSRIKMDLWNQSNMLYVNITRDMLNQGHNENTGEKYNVSKNESYQLTINLTTMYIHNSTLPNDPEVDQIFNYQVLLEQNQPPIGLITNQLFLKATKSTYNNSTTYETALQFSFIQDLFQFNVKINAQFSSSTGYLLYYRQSIVYSPWRIPEILGIVAITAGSILIIELFRMKIQAMLDEKYEVLANSKITDDSNHTDDSKIDLEILNNQNFSEKEIQDSDNNDSYNSFEKNKLGNKPSKKLSWEEYKKLEEQE